MKNLLVLILCISLVACSSSDTYKGDMYLTVISEDGKTITYQMDDFRLSSKGYTLIRGKEDHKTIILKSGERVEYGFTKTLKNDELER